MNDVLVLLLPSNEIKTNTTGDRPGCLNANFSVLEQAKGIQANSSTQFPSFMKQLLKSHLSGKFYLGLPKKFCDAHLPSHDDSIVLVDENEEEYSTKYSVRKNRLSGGWRVFSVAHKLLEGDTLVFHLIEPCKFRVYIVRAGQITHGDGAMGLQTYEFQNSNQTSTVKMEENAYIEKTAKRVYLDSVAVDSHQETKKARLVSDSKLDMHQSGDGIDLFGSDVLDTTRFSESVIHFKDVRGFEDFKIQVGGLILDSEIPEKLRTKYYNLCCTQKMFLHYRLIDGLSSKLAVVMISETTSIADAVRSADLTTSIHHLECWEKTLKAFGDLGMEVGFLRNRLHKLVSLSREFRSTTESKIARRTQADQVSCNLEATSLNGKALIGSLEAEIEALKWKNEKLSFEFQELAQAPW